VIVTVSMSAFACTDWSIQLDGRFVQNHFISFSQHILHFAKSKVFRVALSISSIFPASFTVDVFRLFVTNPPNLFLKISLVLSRSL